MHPIGAIRIIGQARKTGAEDPGECGWSLKGHRKNRDKSSPENVGGKLPNLDRADRGGRTGHDLVNRAQRLSTPSKRKAHSLRVAGNEAAPEIAQPQGTRKTVRRGMRPEFGDDVNAVFIGV